MNKTEIIERIRTIKAERTSARNSFDALSTRISTLGGIDAVEALSAWKTDALAKIETLSPVVRATVKTLLGIE